MKRTVLVLAASTALLAASTPAHAGHAPDRPTGRDYCTETAENPEWTANIFISASVVPGDPVPGAPLHFRVNAPWGVNHLEVEPTVTFTDAYTGEKTVIDLPNKATEPKGRQRLVWTFTVPSAGTVSIDYYSVIYCAGDSTEHADGAGGPITFDVTNPA